ncbi:MAG: efflux RND transporter periplasmic adaptor subunit [Pseudomonadota bacterium]
MLRKTLVVIAIAASLAACSKGDKNGAAKPGGAAQADEKAATLLVAPEDMLKLQSSALTSGPVVTGSVQPERKADLRAEVSAVVLQVLKENGDAVKKGDVLVRLDETAIRDSMSSADEASRVATQALDQAERNLARLKTLRTAGMTSAQALDDSEVRRNAAQGELAAAKTRAAQARQQMQRTVVRAPFDGVVSERKVSNGDTASVGKELLKVIDPTSMRFEGRVSADKIALVKVGQAVNFRINGYNDQEFHGKVKRIDPAANDITRQVEVLVGFSDAAQPRVAGLYAEGHIDAETVAALMLPEGAVVKAGDKAYTWRVDGNVLKKVELVLGARDARTGNYEVKSGLAANASVMRNPASGFRDGQAVTLSGGQKLVNASAGAMAPSAAQGK